MLVAVLVAILGGGILITLTAIFLDSPLGRSLARRFDPGDEAGTGRDARALAQKVEALEDEVDQLNRSLDAAREEIAFIQRLLEDPARKPSRTP